MKKTQLIRLKTDRIMVYKNGVRKSFNGQGQEASIISLRGSNFNSNTTYALIKINRSLIEVSLEDCILLN